MHPVGQTHVLNQLHQSLKAPVKFLLGIDVGVIPQQRYIKIFRQVFQHGAGAGSAAAMQQHPGQGFALFLDNPIQFFLIIPIHGFTIARSSAKSY